MDTKKEISLLQAVGNHSKVICITPKLLTRKLPLTVGARFFAYSPIRVFEINCRCHESWGFQYKRGKQARGLTYIPEHPDFDEPDKFCIYAGQPAYSVTGACKDCTYPAKCILDFKIQPSYYEIAMRVSPHTKPNGAPCESSNKEMVLSFRTT